MLSYPRSPSEEVRGQRRTDTTWQQARKVERTCIVLLEAELDIALGFLRLADAEIKGGNATHADELIDKAGAAYKRLLNGLTTVSLEFEEERRSLHEGVRKLQDSICAAMRNMSYITLAKRTNS